MKTVLISPKDYLNDIIAFGSTQAEKPFMNICFHDAKVTDIRCYDSLNALNEATAESASETLIGFFSSESDYHARQVFIVPELMWEGVDGDIDQGYVIAEKLLDYFKDKPFVLRFISLFSQEQLVKMVKEEHRAMVEVFPHICLDICLKQRSVELDLKAYSGIHYHLIKDIAISNSGRLNYIRHQVNAITRDSINGLTSYTLKILSDLCLPVYLNSFSGCKAKIDDLISKTQALDPNDDAGRQQLQHEITDLIDAIEKAMKNGSAATGSKLPYSVLIIDDDQSHRKELFRFFSERFSNVSCNDLEQTLNKEEVNNWNGTEIGKDLPELKGLTINNANEWLQGQDTKGEMARAEHFNIIILDLLYMKDGIWLPFSGLDLYGIIKDKNPYCTVRVITSLPRNEIGAITSKSNIKLPLSHIFTKGNGWEKLEGCLLDRIDEMERECRINENRRRSSNDVQIPNGGEYFKQLRWSTLIQSGVIEVGAFMQDASKSAEDNTWINCTFPKHGKNFTEDEDYISFLKNCLPHRLALLKWMAANNNGRFELTSYWRECESQGFNKKDKGKYLGEIGFASIKEGKYLNLRKSKLFPEEKEYYIDEINKTRARMEPVCPEILNWWNFYIYPTWVWIIEEDEKLNAFMNDPKKVNNVTIDGISEYLEYFIRQSEIDGSENPYSEHSQYMDSHNVDKEISKKYKKLLREIVQFMPDRNEVMDEYLSGYYELLTNAAK